jgi:DNA repair exonuclease SbcCD ATPase subunit
MLTINKVRFKNFMSYGGAWSEVDFNSSQLSVVVATNGSGKTTINQAVTFGLYNRSINNIPKNKMINSINGKQTVVEVEFTNNGVDYKVIRGMKPNIFQIYKDGKLINEDSSSRDYQQVLETQILKMNYKTFIQTVMVGMSNFTPFMELSTNDRRIVVEDLLGVEIFTTMNTLVKTYIANLNQQIDTLSNEINIKKTEAKGALMIYDTLVENQKNNIDALKQQRKEYEDQIEDHNHKIDSINTGISKLTPVIAKYDQFRNSLHAVINEHGNIKGLIRKIKQDQQFINTNDTCPLCHQQINDEYRKTITNSNTEHENALNEKLELVEAQLQKMQDNQQKFTQLIEKHNELQNNIRTHNNAITMLNNQIANIDKQLTNANSGAQLEEQKRNIESIVQAGKVLMQKRNTLTDEKQIYETCAVLLRDTGIKAAVVNQYLPVINQMINKYLADMDFFLSFEIDNQFNETLKARGRDDITYQNLSQGEKRRLDMAILFTWRYIAQLRNSCSCSNIFIDEVLDSSLDAAGIESVMKLFRSFTNSHIFVISHREGVQELDFDRILTVEKKEQFSVITSQ